MANRKQRREAAKKPKGNSAAKQRRRLQGEPAKIAEKLAHQAYLRDRFRAPDATEQAVQKLNREMRYEMQLAPGEDGAVVGPLRVAANHVAPRLCEIHGLDAGDDEMAAAHYLVGLLGQVIRDFDPNAYRAQREVWRERSHEAFERERAELEQRILSTLKVAADGSGDADDPDTYRDMREASRQRARAAVAAAAADG